jgi:hypothetical protein
MKIVSFYTNGRCGNKSISFPMQHALNMACSPSGAVQGLTGDNGPHRVQTNYLIKTEWKCSHC